MGIRDAVNKAQSDYPLGGFLLCNLDVASDPMYFGFRSVNGAWCIKRYNAAAGTFLYAFGTENYATNWTGRAGLAYNTPDP
jgi:hypothetical protein